MDQRMIELETRVAYHERTIEQLNEALVDQERRIEKMEKKLETLATRLSDALSDDQTSRTPSEL
jgi:SlyX protein